MSNTLQWLLISVLSVVIILILIYNISPNLFKFDFISFISQTPANLGDIFQPKDLSQAKQYEGYESSYDGMILKKDAGYDNIDEVLRSKVTIPDCSICPSSNSNCQPLTVGGINTYKCNECGTCNGISQPGRFNNCLGCDITKETCVMCTDTSEEYDLCNRVKSCILDLYSTNNKNGCFIGEISHNDGTSFNINTLQSVLSFCKDESIKVNMGNNFMKELCYFNSSSISYYDFKTPSDFYLNYTFMNNPLGQGIAFVCFKDGKQLQAFYNQGGDFIENYRIYVAIEATPNHDFKIEAGRIDFAGGVCGSKVYTKELGDIETDAYGFGYGEFDLPQEWADDLKNNPQNNILSGVEVSYNPKTGDVDVGAIAKFYATFYSTNPASNGLWTNELRYPHCNFDTNPENYLKDRPWWAFNNSDNLNSSWYITSGNQNSSIKVFYDSSMPGGGNSLNRGNIKIQLGRLDVNFQRNCKFDIYVCSQDAFAEYSGEGILSLNDFFTNFNPINVYKRLSLSGNGEIILYNYFEFDLDKSYTVNEVESAIKTGFRNWEQNLFLYVSSSTLLDWIKSGSNDGIYQGNWNEISGLTVYDEDCWNNNIQSLITSNDERFIIGNCKDSLCSGKIKIRVAFKYKKPDTSHPEKYPLYPTIAFCSYDSQISSNVCGNGVKEGAEECDPPAATSSQCGGKECQSDCKCSLVAPPPICSSYTASNDCTNVGCKWCSQCEIGNAGRVNQWNSDKCVDSSTDCGYACRIGSCFDTCEHDYDCVGHLPQWCHPNYCTCS